MFKDVLTIARKELKSCFSDKVITAQILFLPFIIVFGFSLLVSAVSNITDRTDTGNYTAYYINDTKYVEEILSEFDLESDNKSDVKSDISSQELDLLVVLPKNLSVADDIGNEDLKIDYSEIYLNTEYEYCDENYIMKELFSILFPGIILMSVFMVCMNLAAETLAGDKERGFLNMILITPIKRSSIAAGKAFCIFVLAVISSISAFIGMVTALPYLAAHLGITDGFSYGIREYVFLFMVTITAAFAFVGIMLILSAVAGNVKRAASTAPVFMLILMFAGMLTVVESVKEVVDSMGIINACIPVWNTMVVMQDVFVCDVSPGFAALTCIINLLLGGIAVFIIGKLLENEKIVNG